MDWVDSEDRSQRSPYFVPDSTLSGCEALPKVLQQAHTRQSDWFLGMLLVVAVLLCGALSHRMTLASSHRSDEERVARAGFVTSDVRRRSRTELVWDSIRTGDSIFAGDLLFVGPNDTASLAFVDGTALELDAGTLISLRWPEENESRGVELKRGGLVGRAETGDLHMMLPSGKAKVDGGGQVRAVVNSEGGFRLEVGHGRAAVRTADGETELTRQQAVAVDDEGALGEVTTLPVTLSNPADNARFFLQDEDLTIEFGWSGPGSEMRFELATDSAFDRVVLSKAVETEVLSHRVTDTGELWWRLTDPTGRPVSEQRRVSVLRANAPQPLQPAPDELVEAPAGKDLRFAWGRIPEATAYAVQVSDTPTFAASALELPSDTGRAAVAHDLPEGTFYWRVVAQVTGRDELVVSDTVAFRLIHRAVVERPSGFSLERGEEP